MAKGKSGGRSGGKPNTSGKVTTMVDRSSARNLERMSKVIGPGAQRPQSSIPKSQSTTPNQGSK